MRAEADCLYDGTMLRLTTTWWNAMLDANKAFGPEFVRFSDVSLGRLQQTIESQNRRAFSFVAERIAVGGRLGSAAISLANGLARTFEAGATTANVDPDAAVWKRARRLTPDVLEHLFTSYSLESDYYGLERQEPWWAAYASQTKHLDYIVRAVRWAFRDQVRRWGDAEGFPLERGLTVDPLRGAFANWSETLFEWGGRLLWAEELLD